MPIYILFPISPSFFLGQCTFWYIIIVFTLHLLYV